MITLLTLLAYTSKTPPDPHDTGTPTADTGATTDTGPSDDTSYDTDDSGDDTAIDTGPVDTGPHDDDDDGYLAADDCDDHDANTYPGAEERCGDGVVNDCDSTEADAAATCGNLLTEYGATASWLEGGVHSNQARLAGLGDINGDGYDDVSVGFVHTGYYDDHGDFIYDSGFVDIYLGPVTGDVSYYDYDARFFSTPEFDYASWDTTGMGDMDGDGYDDFAVGASDDPSYNSETPAVYLVHGPVVGTIYDTDVTTLLLGNDVLDCLGSVLEPTPDADGDGVTDLLVGGRCQGQAHLISGTGDQLTPEDDDIAFFYVPEDQNPGDTRFGHSLASGDLDGDGILDVAIGAPQPSGSGGPRLGFVSVFSGPPSSAQSTDDADHTIAAALTDTDYCETCAGTVMLGSGLTVGDWNHDGHDDIAAGAPMRYRGTSDGREGGTYVYFGPLAQSDYGLPDADLAIIGDDDNDRVGGEMDGDDDIDGDGVDDLLIGNGYAEVNGNSSGGLLYGYDRRAWVLVGPLTSGTVLAADADVILHGTETTVENGVSYGGFGLQARVAGDTDGDGRKEVLVGDWSAQLYLFDIADAGI